MDHGNTIAAISTPYGKSAIGVIRVSGDNVCEIIETFIKKDLVSRRASNAYIYDEDGCVIDNVIVIFYKSPLSYTGEDMLEIQCHGNPLVLDYILTNLCKNLASPSKPGEFTERAFMNNKIDLSQVEAIADVINATSANAAKSATLSLQGNFSKKIDLLINNTVELRASIEAAINFPEDDSTNIRVSDNKYQINNLINRVLQII